MVKTKDQVEKAIKALDKAGKKMPASFTIQVEKAKV